MLRLFLFQEWKTKKKGYVFKVAAGCVFWGWGGVFFLFEYCKECEYFKKSKNDKSVDI